MMKPISGKFSEHEIEYGELAEGLNNLCDEGWSIVMVAPSIHAPSRYWFVLAVKPDPDTRKIEYCLIDPEEFKQKHKMKGD